MLSIGEFSRVTQLSIKALRLYHEKGILIPNKIDMESKYRYYQRSAVEKGLIIKKLKDMGFSLQEIKNIVFECSDDRQLAVHVENKLAEITHTIKEYKELQTKLSSFLAGTQEEKMKYIIDIERIEIPMQLICSIRFKGKYSEVGSRFGRLFKRCGSAIKGKPFSLYYDGDYKEENADIEACISVTKEIASEEIQCRQLTGVQAVTLVHKGPYQELGRSYMRVFEYCREYGLETDLPFREQYLKGPGMIFKGNPQKYLTRLIIPINRAQVPLNT
jgi:DNA-binding transcriptional MerR regulator